MPPLILRVPTHVPWSMHTVFPEDSSPTNPHLSANIRRVGRVPTLRDAVDHLPNVRQSAGVKTMHAGCDPLSIVVRIRLTVAAPLFICADYRIMDARRSPATRSLHGAAVYGLRNELRRTPRRPACRPGWRRRCRENPRRAATGPAAGRAPSPPASARRASGGRAGRAMLAMLVNPRVYILLAAIAAVAIVGCAAPGLIVRGVKGEVRYEQRRGPWENAWWRGSYCATAGRGRCGDWWFAAVGGGAGAARRRRGYAGDRAHRRHGAAWSLSGGSRRFAAGGIRC